MKKTLLILVAASFGIFSCCKKTTETRRDFVEAIVYVEKIKGANIEEPNIMHYYLVESIKKKGFWFCYRAGGIIDFKTAVWEYRNHSPLSALYFESKGGRIGINPHDIPGYFTKD